MDKPFFQLFACCIPVRGALNHVICDLQRGVIQSIPESLFIILTEFKNQTAAEIKAVFEHQWDKRIDEYYRFLEEGEWGFWCDDPARFPDIELVWDSPALITNAIIDIDDDSKHPFEKIFAELNHLGCQALQLRSFGDLSKIQLIEILEKIGDHRLKSIELVMKYKEEFETVPLTTICQLYPRINSVTLHTAPAYRQSTDEHNLELIYTPQKIDSAAHCGVISSQYFTSNLQTFTESQQFNSCLNRKISVDVEGFIKNCPSMKTIFGHINETSLLTVITNDKFKMPWTISKDEIEVCKDCEYRYVCTDCRAYTTDGGKYSKPEKCSYNPYLGRWE